MSNSRRQSEAPEEQNDVQIVNFVNKEEKSLMLRAMAQRTALREAKVLDNPGTTLTTVREDVFTAVTALLKEIKASTRQARSYIPQLTAVLELMRIDDAVGIQNETARIAATANLLESNIKALTELSNNLTSTIAAQTEANSTTAEHINSLRDVTTNLQTQTPHHNAPTFTYADALSRDPAPSQNPPSSQLPPDHADAIAKGDLAERRIVIKPAVIRMGAPSPFGNKTERELVDICQTALSDAAENTYGANHDLETTIAAVTKTAAGGFIAHALDRETSLLLEEHDLKAQFESLLSVEAKADIIAQRQLFAVLAQFVPVTFKPWDADELRYVEQSSGLPDRSISTARFVKPPERRREGQRVANVILGFSTRQAANQAIRDGLSMDGKLVHVHRDVPQPSKCNKCQRMPRDHDAKDCPHQRECARCAQDHDTKDCTIQDTKDFMCANCKTPGHGAASRECPHMLKIAADQAKRQVDAGYRYFPTRDSTTWTMLDSGHPSMHTQAQRGAFPAYRPHDARVDRRPQNVRVDQLIRPQNGNQRGRQPAPKLTSTNNTPLGPKKQHVYEYPKNTVPGNQERVFFPDGRSPTPPPIRTMRQASLDETMIRRRAPPPQSPHD